MIQDLQDLMSVKAALGAAMTQQQQLFVSANWQLLPKFLNSDEGRIALRTFVSDWQAHKPP